MTSKYEVYDVESLIGNVFTRVTRKSSAIVSVFSRFAMSTEEICRVRRLYGTRKFGR